MTVTYPLGIEAEWPIITQSFNLRYRQQLSRKGDGKLIGVDLGYPVWVGSFQTAAISQDECVEFEAILASLGGVAQMVKLSDNRREYPKAYRDGVFADTGLVSAIDVDGIRLSLNTLQPGFVISRGDYFTLFFGGRRYLLQAAESVTADGAGATTPFQTTPPPPYGLAVAQAVSFAMPFCRMRIEPGSIAFNNNADGTGTVSFSGVQV